MKMCYNSKRSSLLHRLPSQLEEFEIYNLFYKIQLKYFITKDDLVCIHAVFHHLNQNI
jgi:hypothetical protein